MSITGDIIRIQQNKLLCNVQIKQLKLISNKSDSYNINIIQQMPLCISMCTTYFKHNIYNL